MACGLSPVACCLFALLFALLLPVACDAAINAVVTWEVRATGADVNGCGFKAGGAGTDYSQQDAKNTAGNNISTTDAVANGTTTLTSATASFTAAIVGNVIYLQGGTGSLAATYREVTAYTNSTTITLDAVVASGTSITMNIGGACASPGWVAGNMVTGNDVFIKSGTYSITTASTNVAGGTVLSVGGVGATNVTRWIGYGTNRVMDNTDTKPLLQASGSISSLTVLKTNGTQVLFNNISVDCASMATCRGIDLANNYGRAIRVKAANATNTGLSLSVSYTFALQVEATGSSTAGAGISIATTTEGCFQCESHGNTVHGFSIGTHANCVNCLSYANTGAAVDGFFGSGQGYACMNCVAYGNGRAGFNLVSNAGNGASLINSIAEGNGVTTSSGGFYATSVVDDTYLYNCAGYNNTGGNYSSTYVPNVFGFQAVTAGSVFTAAAAGDFSLNNTASRGALLRGAGIPGTYPAGTTTGYADIGAAQHVDPPASGGAKATTWVQ